MYELLPTCFTAGTTKNPLIQRSDQRIVAVSGHPKSIHEPKDSDSEIYYLIIEHQDMIQYDIEHSLNPFAPTGKSGQIGDLDQSTLSFRADHEVQSFASADYATIDLCQIPSGPYEHVVQVTDEVTNQTISLSNRKVITE